MVFLGI